MAVSPSCPLLLIHDDDAFRKALIASLDRKHFAVTFTSDNDALRHLEHPERAFVVIVLAVDVASGRGMKALEFLRDDHPHLNGAHLIVLGDPNPDLRTHAAIADETLLKPVDPEYVADRARAYC